MGEQVTGHEERKYLPTPILRKHVAEGPSFPDDIDVFDRFPFPVNRAAAGKLFAPAEKRRRRIRHDRLEKPAKPQPF